MLRNHGLTESYGEWLARLPGYAFIDWEKTELNPLEALAVGFSVAEIAENTGGGIAVGHPAWVIHQYVTTWRMPVVDPGLRVDQRLVDSWSADPAFGVPEVVAVDGGDAGGLLVDHGVVIGDAAVEAVTGAGRPDRSDVVWVSVPLKVFEGLVGREGWLKVAGEVAPRFDRLVESANSQDFPAGPPVLVRGRVRVSVGWYHGVRLGDSDGVVAHEDLAGRSWRPEGGGMRVAGLPDVYAWTQERGLLEPEESGWIKEYLLDPGRGPLPEPVFARERAEVVEILGSRLPADALEDPEIQRGIRLAAEGLFINRVLYGDPEVGRVNHLYDDAFEMPGFGVTAFYHNGMSAAVDLAHIVDNGVRQDAEVGEIVLAMVAEAWSDLVYGGGRRSDNEEGYDELRSAELLEVRALSAGYSRGTAGVLAFAVNGTGFDETNGTQMVSSPTAFEEMRGRWAISDADLPAARRIAGWVAAGDLQTLSEPDALVSSIELALEDLMSRRYGPADRVLGRALSELGSRANTVDAALRFADSYQWLRPRGTGATVRRMLIDRLRGNARFIHPDTGYRPPPGWRLGNPAMRVDHAAKLREIVGRLETDSAYQPSDAYRDALAHTAAMREKYDSPDRTGGHIGSRPAADTGPTGSVGGRHWDSAGNRRTPWSLRSRSSAVGPGRSDRPETPGAAAAAVPVSPSAGAPTTLAHLDARWDSAGNRRTPWSLRSRSSAVGPGRSDRPETPGAAAAAVPVSPSAGAPTTLAHLDARAEEGNYDDRVATPVTTRHEAQFETLDVHPGGHEPPAPAVERLILVNRTAAFDPKVDTSSLGVTRALKDPDSNFGGRIGSRPSADSGPTGSVGQTVNFRHPESGHVDVVFTPPGGAEISLRLVPGKEYVLGRSAVLSGVATNHVSRRHATIRVDDAGHVFLRDDDSKNGTFIDGKQMVAGKWVRVHDGQQLELGRNFELGIDFRRQVAEIRLFGNDAPPLRLHRGSSVVIGRKLLSPARVDRPTMSREHAKVGMDENGRIWLQDIGSMNGTRVNGVRLAEGEQRMLRPGDTVRFGSADGEAQFSPADATGIVAPVQVRLDSGPVPSDREPIPESPFGSMPPFQTTEMLEKFRGEHLPGNSVWEGTHVVYHNSVSRSALRLTIRGGLLYDSAGNLFDTSSGYSAWGGEGRAIFVMDHDGNFYASNYHSMGLFHHSSFLAGGPVAAAGELVVTKGRLQLLTDKSGHYEPARSYTLQAINYLRSLGVEIDMTQVQFDAPQ